MTKEEFHNLIQELLKFGEEPAGLSVWEDIFDDLTVEEREQIIKNLQDELKELQRKG